MLQLLHIENIAVIERADIEFGPGLNVLTGETGAGKSIVIDALNAVTGGRTSKDIVRTGTQAAAVTAVFKDDFTDEWFAENGIERDESGQLFVMRRISADGRSVCRINGAPVSVAQLREIGTELVDIHGQNDGRKLLDESSHRTYLDGFAVNGELYSDFKEKYGALLKTIREIEELMMDEGEKARLTDTLKYQIEELQRAKIKPGEMDELSARRDLLKNASKLTDALDDAFAALYGGERNDGAAVLLEEAESSMSGAARYFEDLASISDKLRDLKYAVQDVAEEVRDMRDSLDFSPNELDMIEDRISLLRRLSRKYGATEEEMLEFLDNSMRQLENIEYSADRLEKLEGERVKRLTDAKKAAKVLSESRVKAARILEKRIMDELSQLNMPGVTFKVAIEPIENEFGLDSHGCDKITFLMSANAGETPGRISRIASGGELSRIMLAMKNVLTENSALGTMVFDEIDTGVSGIAAQRVGEKLSDLAEKRQTLCVTHLPQIAAMADTQFAITKEQSGGRTFTQVIRLDDDGRMRELARLTGGDNVTELTLSSASQQLDAAKAYKSKV